MSGAKTSVCMNCHMDREGLNSVHNGATKIRAYILHIYILIYYIHYTLYNVISAPQTLNLRVFNYHLC